MTVMREIAQVVSVHVNEFRLARTPHDSVIEWAAEKLGKNRDDVKRIAAYPTQMTWRR